MRGISLFFKGVQISTQFIIYLEKNKQFIAENRSLRLDFQINLFHFS